MYALKILSQDDNSAIIGGYGVVFGGEDLEGETFTPDTDFMLDLVPVKLFFIDHSAETYLTDEAGKRVRLAAIDEPVGQVLEVTPDDVGLYMRLQVEKANRYWRIVEQMIGTGKAGLSSGTIGHLARREGKTITRWPIVEESITLTPAEPRTVGVERLKTVAGLNPSLKALVTEAAGTAADDEAMAGDESLDARRRRIENAFMAQYPAPKTEEYIDWWVIEVYDDRLIARLDAAFWQVDFTQTGRAVEIAARDTWVQVEERREWVEAVKSFRAQQGGRKNITVTELNEMSEQDKAQPAVDEQIKALSDRVNQLVDIIEKSPALKSAGYATDDGGAADPTHKSFGDFLLAVKRGDNKRLGAVYGATKDMYEASGAAGGYLVPQEHVTRLMELAAEQSPIYQRVTKIPVTSDAGDFPVLNVFAAPTAGSGGTYGAAGIAADVTPELTELTEVQPTFKNLEWRVHKIGGKVEVSNELIADSAVSIEALLRRLFSIAIGARNERNILRGTGAGEPLGILNSPVAVGITTATDNVFAYADALAMWARFKAFGGGSPVWIMHPSVLPDLGVMTVASGSPVVWAGNLANGQPNTLLGYPIILSEHMPQANGDDVLLADLSAYVMFERQGLSVAYSEHAAFTRDAGVWRFTARNDGQPWYQAPVTLADPTGSYTLSPFVFHND